MVHLEQVLILTDEKRKVFNNWQQVKDIYDASCHCTSITTDMEETVEVEALNQKCLDDLCAKYKEIGFEFYSMTCNRSRGNPR